MRHSTKSEARDFRFQIGKRSKGGITCVAHKWVKVEKKKLHGKLRTEKGENNN